MDERQVRLETLRAAVDIACAMNEIEGYSFEEADIIRLAQQFECYVWTGQGHTKDEKGE